tara:strand:- start:286 stop:750 length:465 start_codon:yes stop_codon:yes gene_type:complete
MNINLKTEKIIKEWTDYNGHMNLAFYIHVFDQAAELILNKFDMGGVSARNDKRSTFAVETHTKYLQEVRVGEEVEVNLLYFNHDKKRIHFKLEMKNKEKKYLAATTEIISLYIDLNLRKVTEFESNKIKLMDEYIKKNKYLFNNEDLKLSNKIK